jgi:hypothetical protein
MIKANIAREYPHHTAQFTAQTLYVADYTNQTKNSPPVRGVEFFKGTPPTNIDLFELKNAVNLRIGYIGFDNNSFLRSDGSSESQCECVVFPETSNVSSWIFFAELKYSNYPAGNSNTLRKAIRQLDKTRTYYFNKNVFSKTNTCYLFASLPMQKEPFPNFIVSQAASQRLKRL